MGWKYLYDYAIPSAIYANNAGEKDSHGYDKHDVFWVEQDANIRGRDYFGEKDWDYGNHHIFDSGFNDWFDLNYKKYR